VSPHTFGAGKEGRKDDYMYALAKPHGSCRGPSGSDMRKQAAKTTNNRQNKTATNHKMYKCNLVLANDENKNRSKTK
jgi:hypothetical protein